MSKNFTFLISLPGGGKTFLANQIQEKDDSVVVLDDISRMLRVTHPGLRYYEVVSQFPEYNKFILSDPAFCDEGFLNRITRELESAFGPNCTFEYIYFENDPEQCLRNVELRNDGRRVERLIGKLSENYKIPEWAIPIPVWRPKV